MEFNPFRKQALSASEKPEEVKEEASNVVEMPAPSIPVADPETGAILGTVSSLAEASAMIRRNAEEKREAA